MFGIPLAQIQAEIDGGPIPEKHRYCKDCKHYRQRAALAMPPVCAISRPEPVHGARIIPCFIERTSGGPCGVEGRLFDAKVDDEKIVCVGAVRGATLTKPWWRR